MRLRCAVFLSAVLAPCCTAAIAGQQASRFRHFVTRQGDKLYDGPEQLRFISWNIPNLLAIEDAFEFLGESPWKWPNEFEIRDALISARQMGGTVVRPYVITVFREGSDMGENVHVLGPGRFNEEAFRTLDLVLKVANEEGVRVIIPLVDNWKWMGGVDQYAAFRGKKGKEFWTDPQLIEDFKQTLRYIVNRRNSYTGQTYRDDKAIFGWETGNELDSTPEWTAEIAACLKQLDGNHLVIDGRSLHGMPLASLEIDDVDVVTTHHYPNLGNNAASVLKAAQLAKGRKAYFVGEFGFLSLDEAQRVFDTVIDNDHISGALYWSLRFHRREGGFYWHHEPLGGDLFKAYHWPGFPSGDEYRERPVIDMICRNASRLNGVTTPSVKPQAPTLLAIDHPGRISWRGSAGASGYDILRACSADGPWETIAEDVSDAAVQYRPLYCDTTAEPGKDYFYRVVARGPGGLSPPSNIVGPVAVKNRLLVDEMGDDSLLNGTAGHVEQVSNLSRRVQEDIHRKALGPGASITYRLDEPVSLVRVFLFSENNDPPCTILASADGNQYEPLPVSKKTANRDAGDYGYLTPVLLEASVSRGDTRFIRIESTTKEGQPSPELLISRVEIAFGGQQPVD